MESTKECPVWHQGPPPHVGWWNASITRDVNAWRWWSGSAWSMPVRHSASRDWAAKMAKIRRPRLCGVEWSDYYPENARVPRVDPRK